MPGADGTGSAGQGREGLGKRFRRSVESVPRLGGYCRCPNCGHTEPYQIATPCYHRKCPKCGAPMTRA